MAVYTQVPEHDLARFVDGHGLGALRSCKGIAEGVENTNYLLETTTGRYILTLYEKRVEAKDLPFYLGLMEHLSGKGIACPLPVRDRNGDQVGELAGRPAAVCTFLDGLSLRAPDAGHCALVGQALARMHLAGLDYGRRRANALGPDGWQPLYRRFAGRADSVQRGLGEIVETELSTLLPVWPRELPQGVIHADLFPDNVFFLEGRLSGIIDFYFACNDVLAYDIAICLNAWCFGADTRYDRVKGKALLEGYAGVRALLPSEKLALPTLARGAALRFLLTRAYDLLETRPDAIVKPHDPNDYVERLLRHRELATPADYGLEG